MDHFYNNNLASKMPKQATVASGAAKAGGIDIKKVEAMFNTYRQTSSFWDDTHCEKFFKDIGVDPEKDILAIYIAFKCDAEKMLAITKEEFTKGCQVVGCDDVARWKSMVPTLRQELAKPENFKDMYTFTFMYAVRLVNEGKKVLPVESALAIWENLIGARCKFMT